MGAQAGSSTYQSSLGSAYNTASQANVGLTTTANQYAVGMAETQAQVQAAQYAGAGAAASGLGSLLGALLAKG
jgi:hypothetical protein